MHTSAVPPSYALGKINNLKKAYIALSLLTVVDLVLVDLILRMLSKYSSTACTCHVM
jgi:hypothetical protein